jgi:hypothetical protein
VFAVCAGGFQELLNPEQQQEQLQQQQQQQQELVDMHNQQHQVKPPHNADDNLPDTLNAANVRE